MFLREAVGPGFWVGQEWCQVHSLASVGMGEVGGAWVTGGAIWIQAEGRGEGTLKLELAAWTCNR